jgi:hypothetical protein
MFWRTLLGVDLPFPVDRVSFVERHHKAELTGRGASAAK